MLITKNQFLNRLLIVISFLIINYYILINLLDCYTYYLLLIWLNFVFQKCENKRFITKSTNKKYYLVMYYSKYYYKLKYIKYFQYNTKKWV